VEFPRKLPFQQESETLGPRHFLSTTIPTAAPVPDVGSMFDGTGSQDFEIERQIGGWNKFPLEKKRGD